MLLLTVIVFVVLLLALVLVHEWGHFIAAKKAGCNVEEFGFGFPPKLFGVKWHGTEYTFNLLPIGGFVKIEGEDMETETPGPSDFASKSIPWRVTILAAGVAMNVLLAWVLLSVQSVVGMPTVITEANGSQLTNQQTYILEVAPNSPAAEAGLQDFDRIVSIADVETPAIADLQRVTTEQAGESIELVVNRQGITETVTLTPRVDPPPNEGALGVSLAATGLQQSPWWQAPWQGLKRTGIMLAAIVTQFGSILGQLVSTGSVGGDLAGPVGIAVLTNEVTTLGFPYVLEFGALISLNLALINILPFPALDGGRIVFVLIEALRGGRRLKASVERYVHTAGFAFLILLMLLITFRDIQRFF